MRTIRSLLLLFLLSLATTVSAQGEPAPAPSQDEVAIRALIDRWYAERRAGAGGRDFALLAPGAIDASPGYTVRRLESGMRSAAAAPRVYSSLAATALLFRHDVSRLVLDTRFARAWASERGYFYAWATQQTYERLGTAHFVLEKQQDGRWLVLAHKSDTMGIPPGMATNPMPDLRDLYYSTANQDRELLQGAPDVAPE